MGCEGIERGVVHRGEQFGACTLGVGSLDFERPFFLSARFEFVAESLPFEGQFFVLPRDGNLSCFRVETVFTDVGNSDGDPAAHLFNDR